MIAMYSEIVEGNGKTIKENNLSIKHKIPIGTLVEIVDSHTYQGIRLYVVEHQRDCDGEPLYGLGYKDLARQLQEALGTDAVIYRVRSLSVYSGLGEEQLKVIPDKTCAVLNELMEEYLLTQNDEDKYAEERFGTRRELARDWLEDFLHWLSNRE